MTIGTLFIGIKSEVCKLEIPRSLQPQRSHQDGIAYLFVNLKMINFAAVCATIAEEAVLEAPSIHDVRMIFFAAAA